MSSNVGLPYAPPLFYFNGITYDPAFFPSTNYITLDYANNQYLARVGVAISIATLTAFNGLVNFNSIAYFYGGIVIAGGITITGGLTCDTLHVTGLITGDGGLTITAGNTNLLTTYINESLFIGTLTQYTEYNQSGANHFITNYVPSGLIEFYATTALSAYVNVMTLSTSNISAFEVFIATAGLQISNGSTYTSQYQTGTTFTNVNTGLAGITVFQNFTSLNVNTNVMILSATSINLYQLTAFSAGATFNTVIPTCSITATTTNQLCNYTTVSGLISSSGTALLAAANAWTGNTNTFNSFLPTSTITATTANQLCNYTTCGLFVNNGIANTLASANAWTGNTNTFNSFLPTSTITATTANQLCNYTTVSGLISASGTGLLASANIWTALNTFNAGVTLGTSSNLIVGGTTTLNNTTTINVSGGTATALNLKNSTNSQQILISMDDGVGNYNPTTQANDTVFMISGASADTTTALNIIPWSATATGLRLSFASSAFLAYVTGNMGISGTLNGLILSNRVNTSNICLGDTTTLSSLTSGISNVCIGSAAGNLLTASSGNTNIGFQTMNDYTTGNNYNTSIGYQANSGTVGALVNSTAIGALSNNLASHEVMLGTTSEYVVCPNYVRIGTGFAGSGASTITANSTTDQTFISPVLTTTSLSVGTVLLPYLSITLQTPNTIALSASAITLGTSLSTTSLQGQLAYKIATIITGATTLALPISQLYRINVPTGTFTVNLPTPATTGSCVIYFKRYVGCVGNITLQITGGLTLFLPINSVILTNSVPLTGYWNMGLMCDGVYWMIMQGNAP